MADHRIALDKLFSEMKQAETERKEVGTRLAAANEAVAWVEIGRGRVRAEFTRYTEICQELQRSIDKLRSEETEPTE